MVPNKEAWFWLCIIDILICQVAWLSPAAIIRSLGKASPRSRRPITGALILGEAASLTGASGRNVLKQREECNEWIKVGKAVCAPVNRIISVKMQMSWGAASVPPFSSYPWPHSSRCPRCQREVRELSKDRGRGREGAPEVSRQAGLSRCQPSPESLLPPARWPLGSESPAFVFRTQTLLKMGVGLEEENENTAS